jgi:hypothetical protein
MDLTLPVLLYTPVDKDIIGLLAGHDLGYRDEANKGKADL